VDDSLQLICKLYCDKSK